MSILCDFFAVFVLHLAKAASPEYNEKIGFLVVRPCLCMDGIRKELTIHGLQS